MNAINRALWIFIGLILLAAGALGALLSRGILKGANNEGAIVPSGVDETWRSWGVWAPVASIVLGVVLMVLGVTLLRAETRRRGAGGLGELTMVTRPVPGGVPQPPAAPGLTKVAGRTLSHALSVDLARDRHIDAAAAQLSGPVPDAEVRIRLAVAAGTDLRALHRVVADAMRRFEKTSGLRPHLADVDVEFSNPATARVQ